ncbi:MAG: hypothetical protein KatS3mg077_2593 [Candidatus Binatia bacterium]|nr:MAG: hypothetical protein KatS3mg077_2593 [Candidatus Binatia bacterium]
MPLMWWRCAALGIVLGMLVETAAWLFRLWEFRRRTTRFVTIVLMYGLVMGSLAAQVQPGRWLAIYTLAALIGLSVELWNLQFGRWWRFPDGHDDHGARRAAMVLVLAALWGVVPLAIAEGEAALQQKWAGPVSPLARLAQRERALQLRKELLHQRLQDVDRRLRDVEERRRRLQRKLGLGTPEESRMEEKP